MPGLRRRWLERAGQTHDELRRLAGTDEKDRKTTGKRPGKKKTGKDRKSYRFLLFLFVFLVRVRYNADRACRKWCIFYASTRDRFWCFLLYFSSFSDFACVHLLDLVILRRPSDVQSATSDVPDGVGGGFDGASWCVRGSCVLLGVDGSSRRV